MNHCGISIEVSNIGPIINAKIDVKPLTILIGDNISGKSYTAMLLESFFSTIKDLTYVSYKPLLEHYIDLFGIKNDIIEELANYLVKTFPQIGLTSDINTYISNDNSNPNKDFIVNTLSDFLKDPIHNIDKNIKEVFHKKFIEKIVNTFQITHLSDLIYEHKGSLEESVLSITINNLEYQAQIVNNELLIKNLKGPDPLRFITNEDISSLVKPIIGLGPIEVFDLNHTTVNASERAKIKELQVTTIAERLSKLAQSKLELFLKYLPVNVYYLPASRAAFLQYFQSAPKGIANIRSNIFLDFYEKMSSNKEKFLREEELKDRKNFLDIAKEIEYSILGGKVAQKNQYDGIKNKFYYQSNSSNKKISVSQSSTMILELLPLVHYIRNFVDKDSILIIEEPEAHLHPAVIIELAKVLAELANNGVNIIITTHSPILLSQINLLIRWKGIKPNREYEHTYKDNQLLDPKNIGVYFYKRKDSERIGSIIEKADIDVDGISESTFQDVSRKIYHENIDLDYLIE